MAVSAVDEDEEDEDEEEEEDDPAAAAAAPDAEAAAERRYLSAEAMAAWTSGRSGSCARSQWTAQGRVCAAAEEEVGLRCAASAPADIAASRASRVMLRVDTRVAMAVVSE